MKKRILCLILSLTMLLACVPCAASAETSGKCGNNAIWTLDDNGTLTISGTGSMWDWNQVRQLNSITIPDSLTSLGRHKETQRNGIKSRFLGQRQTMQIQ